jgi:glycosyltransferase involved in cell wall biosynthesis
MGKQIDGFGQYGNLGRSPCKEDTIMAIQDIVSVIVPIYNAEQTLDRCVQSILDQRYEALEIFLINDGSLDGSLRICSRYAEQDNRITVVDTPNRGVSAARNEGIKRAKGKFLGFVDSDDWIESEHFELLVEAMNSAEKAVLSVIGVVGKAWEEYLEMLCKGSKECVLSVGRSLEEITHRTGLQGYLPNKLFLNTQLFLKEHLTICEDLEYVTRYLQGFPEAKVSVINRCTYHYIVPPHEGFLASRVNVKRSASLLDAYDAVITNLTDSEERLQRRIRGRQCLVAFNMLRALDYRKDQTLDDEYRDRAVDVFEQCYEAGYEEASQNERTKLLLYRRMPLLLRIVEKVNYRAKRIMARQEGRKGIRVTD